MVAHIPDDRAKHPRTILAGPYGHPLHPILITVPVGSWIAALVFDVMALLSEDRAGLLMGSQILVGIGIVGALVAAILGFLDYSVIPPRTPAKRTAVVHMVLNLLAVVVFAFSWLARASADGEEIPVIGIALTLIGLALISVSGYLGGKLAYHYGVRVAGEEKQVEGFQKL
ncbi:DUF2231 domain-containing protein [Agrococcus sp. HG114]|uniref:DUF2231 domain-containing protein n=1 Tax=Agrococcus sp. HG114 TaxID=2969757 RepID=UPI00215A1392|nr:DUF2231 domain-containing protein [Agrococcus sp. HG114]MCR8671852.1 DUF2231 domain-containing protein [Agrococcus sp. HG114]